LIYLLLFDISVATASTVSFKDGESIYADKNNRDFVNTPTSAFSI